MVKLLKEIFDHAKKRRQFRQNSSKYVNKSSRVVDKEESYIIIGLSLVNWLVIMLIVLIGTTVIGSLLLFFVKGFLRVLLLMGVLVVIFFVVKYMKKFKNGRTIIISLIILSTLVFSIGAYSQNKINDKPVLINTTQDKSYKMANELLTDLLTLEDNQKLLIISKSQARGISTLYIDASKQSQQISARWNPVVNNKPPLPGFIEVFSKVNRAADIQSQELTIYYNLLQQSDAKSEEQLAALEKEYTELIYGETGAVLKLVATVKPLGIKLEVGHGS